MGLLNLLPSSGLSCRFVLGLATFDSDSFAGLNMELLTIFTSERRCLKRLAASLCLFKTSFILKSVFGKDNSALDNDSFSVFNSSKLVGKWVGFSLCVAGGCIVSFGSLKRKTTNVNTCFILWLANN